MLCYTGDIHGKLTKIDDAMQKGLLTNGDVLVILGDAGFNYYGGTKDKKLKCQLGKYDLTVFCIHGNHEMRPEGIASYKTKVWNGGTVFYEEEYPYLLFAKDGEVYDLAGKQTLVCGGAYSVDKYYRLKNGFRWFADEQPSKETKELVESRLEARDWKIDQILTHTCPLRYTPTEAFLSCVDQNTVDNSTEAWLDAIEEKTEYSRWLCGHWHIDKCIDKLRFVMDDFII